MLTGLSDRSQGVRDVQEAPETSKKVSSTSVRMLVISVVRRIIDGN